jgi:apolipoprotein N-acyltransferase
VPRTGIHWLVDHFVVYFAVTAVICLACPRPFLVATSLMLLAGLLEALQGVTLERTPDLLSALSGAGGVLTAALLAWVVIRTQKMKRLPSAVARTLSNRG